MSDQNLTEESINNESITENESIQSQDQKSFNDQEISDGVADDVIEVDEEESKIEVIKINQEEEEEEKEEKEGKEEKEEKSKYPEEEGKPKGKDEKSEDETKENLKNESKEENKESENETQSQKGNDNKKFDKDENFPSGKRNGYSSNYRNSDKNYGRFPPRGHQYSHHPYDDWGRRRGNMNYPPYFEKDRRHGGMRNDFRGRDYRDFYDSRNMGRDFRGFRDRERDFDYPKFYGRGRDQRFFNKRDRDFKYKRDYYDDYNMRNMDKDMRMNNSMKECRVYVQNLSYDVTSEMLSRFMESVGKVVSAEILTSPDGRSKGCAIVQYETPNEARRAISDLQDKPFQGRPIHIREDREGMQYNSQMMQDKNNYMSDKQVGYQGEGSSNYQNTPKEQRIFVGNLDVSVTAEELRTLFEPAGTINYADVFQKDRNQSSKHGIIGFQDSASIKKAIEMFNGIQYRNRKLDVHEDRRGIVPVRRFNSYKSDKNISIHNASHHPYQPNSKPYPPNRGKGNNPYNNKYNNRQPPHHQSMPNSQQKMQQPPLPPHPSNSTTQDKSNNNKYMNNPSHLSYQQQQQQQQNNSNVAYPTHQPTAQHNSQTVPMPYNQSTNQTSYIQPMATTYSQPAQSTYAQPQGVQPTTSVPVYAGYPMADQVAAANSNVAAYQNSYQTAAYYSSISHQAQPVTVPASQPVQQPYPVATNVDYNNLYSAYYGQASQVGATTGYPMMTQTTTTATVQGQAGYTAEGSTLPTTYNYY